MVEIASCMRAVDTNLPALRLVLWGAFGTGKTVTLNQAVHHAHSNKWAIVHIRSAMDLTRRVKEIEMSSFVSGRINDPSNAVAILQNFKQQNQHIWKTLGELFTERDYEWSKSERTLKDKPITEIIEMGISAPFLASDCVGALFRELRRHSNIDKLKVLVAVDDANSLWGKTLVKRADRTYALPSDLTLVVHLRRMITNDWNNGCVLMVADKKEVADARDELSVSRHTPLELFGEEGFEYIEVSDAKLSLRESVVICSLFCRSKQRTTRNAKQTHSTITTSRRTGWRRKQVRVLARPLRYLFRSLAARSEEGRKQLMHLSAFNPFYYERLCAFN